MLAEERYSSIYNQIVRVKAVKIDELAKQYSVTPMTIRRDLDKLEQTYPNIKRCHGGAVLSEEVNIEVDFESKKTINVSEKKIIADKAFELINEGDTIYIDAGTTTLLLAKKIVEMNYELTIVTNDIEVAKVLKDTTCDVLVTGGQIQKSTGCMVGSFAEDMISKIKFKIAFMGATAINEAHEVLTPSIEKRTLKPLVLKNASRSYLLVDSTKFNKNSAYFIYTLSDFTGVITGKQFSDSEKNGAEEQGIELITV